MANVELTHVRTVLVRGNTSNWRPDWYTNRLVMYTSVVSMDSANAVVCIVHGVHIMFLKTEREVIG